MDTFTFYGQVKEEKGRPFCSKRFYALMSVKKWIRNHGGAGEIVKCRKVGPPEYPDDGWEEVVRIPWDKNCTDI